MKYQSFILFVIKMVFVVVVIKIITSIIFLKYYLYGYKPALSAKF